ncbi:MULTISPECIES: glycosyltransferase family 32 protein [unclassified Tenacibaculum]|uniref:glycosyltransferase family 32 protein n=1 Tax=unclassified Tenacibaculum TaxID=2635139 RepID=UPI001F2687A8|nr:MULTISPECIES: glycosyltransferase [unclassified Tenacibaculum]MCF2873821.1 hypothetical protein [Tenacibaculum sp. Cn5-1]MCF2933977.1 hypothetical protein [Tenacibaculum sp. Cn5-34]MCG7509441.1 hypothetical protein [Tenacibaculum sp. Cn5-46]
MNEIDKKSIAENDNNRSRFIYDFLQKKKVKNLKTDTNIPKKIMQYWHSSKELPKDVSKCIQSWKILEKQGFMFDFFDDESAKVFISQNLEKKHLNCYLKCHHPAMRSDYFRLCYLYISGGFYVDCDEFFLDNDITLFFSNNNIKIQPLCYSIKHNNMIEKEKFLYTPYDKNNIYYFNNDLIISPPQHPLIFFALERATNKLLKDTNIQNIQSTTGPGNLSASVVYYLLEGENELEIIEHAISKNIWDLDYRKDDRNWRLYKGDKKKWFNR